MSASLAGNNFTWYFLQSSRLLGQISTTIWGSIKCIPIHSFFYHAGVQISVNSFEFLNDKNRWNPLRTFSQAITHTPKYWTPNNQMASCMWKQPIQSHLLNHLRFLLRANSIWTAVRRKGNSRKLKAANCIHTNKKDVAADACIKIRWENSSSLGYKVRRRRTIIANVKRKLSNICWCLSKFMASDYVVWILPSREYCRTYRTVPIFVHYVNCHFEWWDLYGHTLK